MEKKKYLAVCDLCLTLQQLKIWVLACWLATHVRQQRHQSKWRNVNSTSLFTLYCRYSAQMNSNKLRICSTFKEKTDILNLNSKSDRPECTLNIESWDSEATIVPTVCMAASLLSMHECVCVCVCVCTCTAIFVRTNLSFRPLEWGRFWKVRTFWFCPHFGTWLVMVRVRA